MSLFSNFRRKRKNPREMEDAPQADETAPGLKAIKQLWDIAPKKSKDLIEGEVETDIYVTNRSNGIPRRRRPRSPYIQPDNPAGPPY